MYGEMTETTGYVQGHPPYASMPGEVRGKLGALHAQAGEASMSDRCAQGMAEQLQAMLQEAHSLLNRIEGTPPQPDAVPLKSADDGLMARLLSAVETTAHLCKRLERLHSAIGRL